MRVFISLVAVGILILLPILGAAADLRYLFGVIIPYFAILAFLLGVIYRIFKWARSPVPFRITTTCGQQQSLGWIRSNKLDNPHSTLGTLGRMALEVLFFRSLFRNTRTDLRSGPRLVYGADKWLWAGSLAFHYSFLIIFIRHFRFFAEPVPQWVLGLHNLDGFFQIGLPVLLITDIVVVAALTFLFFRRVLDVRLRYFSLAADYFPLLLIGSVVVSGI